VAKEKKERKKLLQNIIPPLTLCVGRGIIIVCDGYGGTKIQTMAALSEKEANCFTRKQHI